MDYIDRQQQRRLKLHDLKLHCAARSNNRAEDAVQELTATVDRLELALRAMWSLVSEKTDLDAADLAARMAELDASDGRADGKLETPPRRCNECERPNGASRHRCLYCDAILPPAAPL